MPDKNRHKFYEIKGSVLAKNALYNLLGLGLPVLVGVATIPLIIQKIGNERFGILSLAWAVFSYLSIFDIGLVQATTKFVAESLGKGERHQVPQYVWTTIIFQIILGVVGALIFILLTPLLVQRVLNIPQGLRGEAQAVFIMMALSLPVALVSGSFRGTLEAGQRFDLVNVVKIPSGAASNLFPLAGAFIGLNLPGIVFLILCSRLLTLMAWAVLCFRIFPEIRKKISFCAEKAKPLLSFGSWITVSSLINPVLTYLDRFMIGALLSVTAVSYYSVPYEMTVRLGILPGSLLILLLPAFSALKGMQNEQKAQMLFGRSFKFIMIGIGAIVASVIIFARFILGIWVGQDFARESSLVLQILAAGYLFNTLAKVAVGFILGLGRSDLPAKFHVLEMLIYIPTLWLLIKRFGIQGAALAWSLRVTLDMMLLYFAASRIGGKSFPNLLRFGLVPTIVALFGFASVCLLTQSLMRSVSGIVPALVALGLAAWYWILSPEERAWILLQFKGLWQRKQNGEIKT